MLQTWTAINSVLSAVTAAIVYLLIRQVGILSQRLGLASARPTTQGPRHGENVTYFVDHLGVTDPKSILYIFSSASCPICRIIAESANSLASKWAHETTIVLVYEDVEDQQGYVSKYKNCQLRFDPDLRKNLSVTFVPFAMKTTHTKTVVATGLVNSISHLESLLEAGVA